MPAIEGELCIGGLLQARGYVGLPSRTAAAWIPDELGRAGGRLYRTGDLSCLLPDGDVQIIGRYTEGRISKNLQFLELTIK